MASLFLSSLAGILAFFIESISAVVIDATCVEHYSLEIIWQVKQIPTFDKIFEFGVY